MELEFELELVDDRGEQKNKCYHVMRKGLTVGTLWLNGEYYEHLSGVKEIKVK